MASSSRNRSDIEWLYPNLLSCEGLIHILKQRFIKTDGSQLETLDKDSLVALYNMYILPLPQRAYKHNRLGREMTKRQILHAKKRKISLIDEDEIYVKQSRSSTHQHATGPSRGLVNNSYGSSPPSNRLKPPPSCVNFDKKVVQLGSSKLSAASPSQSVHNGDRKAMKLKCSSGDDSSSAKRSKLEDGGTVSPSQAGLNKITWP